MSKYFLFANPSFVTGFARVLDLGGTLNEYNYSLRPASSDFYAIHSDWRVVGSDLLTAMVEYEDELAAHGEE